jgi:hypothetical protein
MLEATRQSGDVARLRIASGVQSIGRGIVVPILVCHRLHPAIARRPPAKPLHGMQKRKDMQTDFEAVII